MKKQTLLALTAGIALTASGISFATTTQTNSTNGTTITGYSDQSTQDQGTTQGQTTNTTTSTKRKVDFTGSIGFEKVADSSCAGGKCGKTGDSNTKNKDQKSNTSGNDTTTQKS